MNHIQNLLRQNKWTDDAALLPFLADRLSEGNLLIFLGAGVSRFYGMPDWETMLRDIKRNGAGHHMLKSGLSMPAWAEEIRNNLFPDDKAGFETAVSDALYSADGLAKFDLLKVADNKTLRSIGALCHGSRRGYAKKVVTLNYDCLLEAYFRFHGVAAQTIHSPTFLERGADVTIYHPHGYIPHPSFDDDRSNGIVLTRDDYERAVDTRWEETILGLLSTHFVLFIGLSGEDDRISRLCAKAKESNPFILKHELPFYGVRVCSKGGALASQWKARGVYCKEVAQLNRSIPNFLFSICREAASRS